MDTNCFKHSVISFVLFSFMIVYIQDSKAQILPNIPDTLYAQNEFAIWFREGVLNKDYLGCRDMDLRRNNSPKILALPLDTSFIRSSALVNYLTTIGATQVSRFSEMFSPCFDTLSIARFGDTVRMTDVWNIIRFKRSSDTPNILAICLFLTITFQSELNFAQPNFYIEPMAGSIKSGDEKKISMVPTDPKYTTNQFSLHDDDNKGSFLEYTWNRTTGDRNIIIGVIDDGIFHYHEDFGNQTSSQFPQPSMKITNAKNNHSNSQQLWESNHGTAMAGIIGAITNNQKGIVGIVGGDGNNLGVQLNAFKAMLTYAGKNTLEYAAAIFEASARSTVTTFFGDTVGFGNHILNMSVGTPIHDAIMRRAIAFGYQNGVINVSAKGNDGIPCNKCNYPSDFRPEWGICVGALREYKVKKDDSNYGDNLDLLAPGYEDYIFTTRHGINFNISQINRYTIVGQTSSATAHVSGVAGLILSEHKKNKKNLPNYLAPKDVESLLRISAVDIFPPFDWDIETGDGWLHATKCFYLLEYPWELDHWNVIINNPEQYLVTPLEDIPQQPVEKAAWSNVGNKIFFAKRGTIRYPVLYPRVCGYNEVAEKAGRIRGVWGRGSESPIDDKKQSLGWPHLSMILMFKIICLSHCIMA